MTGGGAPRSTAHHGLFVSMGALCPTPPTTGAPLSTTCCLYPQRHPPFHGGTQPNRVVYCIHGIHTLRRGLDTSSHHWLSVSSIYAGKTRHHGLCVVDLWTSSDVKRDQTFQSESDIELDMGQYITRHSLVSVTKRLLITSEDRAVPAFILAASSASVTTAHCTTAP